MAPWPTVEPEKVEPQLIHDFDVVQRVVGLGRAARNQTKLRVRQPLSRLLVRVPDEAAAKPSRQQRQILEELNVKTLELVARDAELVSYRIKPNLAPYRQALGKLIPAVRDAWPRRQRRYRGRRGRRRGFELESAGKQLTSMPRTCSSRQRPPRATPARRRAAIWPAWTRGSMTSYSPKVWRASWSERCRKRANRRARGLGPHHAARAGELGRRAGARQAP